MSKEDTQSDVCRTNSSDLSPKIPKHNLSIRIEGNSPPIPRISSSLVNKDSPRVRIQPSISRQVTSPLYSQSFIETHLVKNVNRYSIQDNEFFFYFNVIEIRYDLRGNHSIEEKHLFKIPLTEIQQIALLYRITQIYAYIGSSSVEFPYNSCCIKIGIITYEHFIGKDKDKMKEKIESLLPKVVPYHDSDKTTKYLYLSSIRF